MRFDRKNKRRFQKSQLQAYKHEKAENMRSTFTNIDLQSRNIKTPIKSIQSRQSTAQGVQELPDGLLDMKVQGFNISPSTPMELGHDIQ